MKLPEDKNKNYRSDPPRISYIAYRGLGWLFVFAILTAMTAYGFLFVRGFFYKLSKIIPVIAAWEVLGIAIYLRWNILVSMSGGLWTLYELLFPWRYPAPDEDD